jgi:membrane protein implicated in regulation of membrane protease activity
MTDLMIFWLVAVVLLAIVEIVTFQLVAIWIAIGGVCALAANSLNQPEWVQFTVFIVVSAVLLIFTRPICKKFLSTKKVSTNADRHIGTIAVVTEDIDNLAQTGRAVISGVPWMARSVDKSLIKAGESVRVERIEGVKLIVSKYEPLQ